MTLFAFSCWDSVLFLNWPVIHYVAHADLELMVTLLPQSSQYWDNMNDPPYNTFNLC